LDFSVLVHDSDGTVGTHDAEMQVEGLLSVQGRV
jgi:hypothetical protein